MRVGKKWRKQTNKSRFFFCCGRNKKGSAKWPKEVVPGKCIRQFSMLFSFLIIWNETTLKMNAWSVYGPFNAVFGGRKGNSFSFYYSQPRFRFHPVVTMFAHKKFLPNSKVTIFIQTFLQQFSFFSFFVSSCGFRKITFTSIQLKYMRRPFSSSFIPC